MSQEKKKITIVAISGSMRSGNFTSKALALVLDELGKDQNVQVDLIDPIAMDLSFNGDNGGQIAQSMQKIVSKATGVILATPEYHGSYSSVIKLIIDNLGYPSVMAGKPIALLGVAAGQIGAIKALEHLRSVCSHVGAIVLPGPVSVAGVHNVFNEEGICSDPKIDERIRTVATNLLDYIDRNICPRKALEDIVRSN